jgi:hypothetical protein
MKEHIINLDKPRTIRFTAYTMERASREFGVPELKVIPWLQRKLIEGPAGWQEGLARVLWTAFIDADRELTVADMERTLEAFLAERPVAAIAADLVEIARAIWAVADEALREGEISIEGFVFLAPGSKPGDKEN